MERIAATRDFAAAVRDAGWAVTAPVMSEDELAAVGDAVAAHAAVVAGRGGLRNLLEVLSVRWLARSPEVRSLAEAVLGAECRCTRGLFFDKTPGANWKVGWHQDLTIAVRGRREADGFGPWSEKAGIVHVQPPDAVLEAMLALRIHLDECGPESGPVRVLPGSHREGKLDPAAIGAWKARAEPVECLVAGGGILAFRPLLLHASSPATRPSHRRVVHLEFAAGGLPGGLEWRWSA